MASAALLTIQMMGQNALNVYSKSGSVVTYTFAEKPVVTYQDNVLVLTTEKVSVEYPLAELDKITFSDVESSVENITMSQPNGDGTVRIYSVSGTLIRTIERREDASDVQFSIENLSEGIYIIKQGTQTYKIIKQ